LYGLALAITNKDELEYEKIETEILIAFIEKSPSRMKVFNVYMVIFIAHPSPF